MTSYARRDGYQEKHLEVSLRNKQALEEFAAIRQRKHDERRKMHALNESPIQMNYINDDESNDNNGLQLPTPINSPRYSVSSPLQEQQQHESVDGDSDEKKNISHDELRIDYENCGGDNENDNNEDMDEEDENADDEDNEDDGDEDMDEINMNEGNTDNDNDDSEDMDESADDTDDDDETFMKLRVSGKAKYNNIKILDLNENIRDIKKWIKNKKNKKNICKFEPLEHCDKDYRIRVNISNNLIIKNNIVSRRMNKKKLNTKFGCKIYDGKYKLFCQCGAGMMKCVMTNEMDELVCNICNIDINVGDNFLTCSQGK